MLHVTSFLYSLAVEPIEYVLETAFCYFRNFFSGRADVAMAVAAVSLLVNVLTLPVYNAADARQLEERARQGRMGAGVAHIRATFRGDERFLMLSEYYRQNGYSPASALCGSLSILVQLPFFIAAYRFLSNCPELSGVGFGPIADLSAPDGMLRLGSRRGNLLPVLMTAVNLVSGAVYTRGAPLREKLQGAGLALVFLVLLYGSPSGLVFYWTLNNLFSLAKNFIRSRRNPSRTLRVLLCALLLLFSLYVAFFRPRARLYKKLALLAFSAGACLLCRYGNRPGFLKAWKLPAPAGGGWKAGGMRNGSYGRLLVASCLGLLVLVGACVPLSVLSAEPEAFSFLEGYSSPFRLFWPTLVKAAGLFLLWPLFIYLMAGERARWLLAGASAGLFLSAVVNFYAFSTDYGILSDLLVYEKDGVFDVGWGGIRGGG